MASSAGLRMLFSMMSPVWATYAILRLSLLSAIQRDTSPYAFSQTARSSGVSCSTAPSERYCVSV